MCRPASPHHLARPYATLDGAVPGRGGNVYKNHPENIFTPPDCP